MNKKNKKQEENEDIIFEEEDLGARIKKLKDKLAICEKERKEYLDGWQRARADYANAKKEGGESISKIKDQVEEEIFAEIIPVLDSFEMAFSNKESWEKVDKSWRMGVEYIHSQLISVLNDHSINELGSSGEEFDPKLHHSAEEEATENKNEDGKIARVIQKGYIRKDKILRPARVVVYSYQE